MKVLNFKANIQNYYHHPSINESIIYIIKILMLKFLLYAKMVISTMGKSKETYLMALEF